MLMIIRRILATIFLLGITLIFLDFTGATHAWLSWMTRLQFIPAVLSGSLAIVAAIAILTLIFGRVYCSIICPLGVSQDAVALIGRKMKRNRYRWSKPKTALRLASLGVFILACILGISVIVGILAPYSTYGRMVASILTPAAGYVNNLIASWSDSTLIHHRDVWFKTGSALILSIISIIVIGTLAYRNGRTWCNTVCPVGTVLGFLSRYSLLKVSISTDKCVNCGLCARNCKAGCIDFKNHAIDYSRCVACMDCLGKCSTHAITYGLVKPAKKQPSDSHTTDAGRRNFLTATAVIATSTALEAKKKVDGGLAVIEDKKIPARGCGIVPPGAESIKNVTRHCTACQLCITACPNQVLRPSADIDSLMQPRSSFERGYCRPECTRCSHVCPTGAISPITAAEKTTISVGHAVWIRDNCIPVTKGHNCRACERHCPTGAITRVPLHPEDPDSVLVPTVDVTRCIGCGACEYYCPARPLAAMYIEGNSRHITL
ncbi:MAG: 4Fe-4S binding protein [Muribaculaceae bacterium]|nr:4Fe-4S binding protein [Muribaculaceae bacterium]